MLPPKELHLLHGKLELPLFLPDATFGQVRGLSADDTAACGTQAVMMNTFHLMQKPGSSTVKALGGLHRMTGWELPIFTDSGGFQAYSLIRQNSKFGNITETGILLKPEASGKKILLSPEKCIQLQMGFGADVLFCMDDCTHIDDLHAEQELSVARTIRWAKACKKEYERLCEEKKLAEKERPRIFAVVQGGSSVRLRRRCAEALLETGFDGFGYGGWPLDKSGSLVEDMVALTRELIPEEFPLHALGIGHPPFIAFCAKIGYRLFDSAMPTRDARHGRLYRLSQPINTEKMTDHNGGFEYVYIHDKRYFKSSQPVEENCECPVCQKYSLGYLRHLFKINDTLYQRLATQHNLQFINRLMANLQII